MMKTVATWRVVKSIPTWDILAPVGTSARVAAAARGWNNKTTCYQQKGGFLVARNGDGSRRFQSGLSADRLPSLKKLLQTEGRILRILETHSGLSGLVAEHAMGSGNGQTFDGMWSSSLTASLVRGMPDIEAVDTSSRLALVQETMAVTTKPMIYDGDTGGTPAIFKFTVRALEQLGVSAVIIEDKEGLKQNSLLANSNSLHQLCDIEIFCDKIRAGIQARRSSDFMIIARMESLIAGRPMAEAVTRAVACVDAGASAVMIHSRKKSADEVFEFMSRFRSMPGCQDTPIVVVPTSYNTTTEYELQAGGASICIYANQLLRAAYPSMMNTAESILGHSRAYEAEENLLSVQKIVNLVDHDGEMSALHNQIPESSSIAARQIPEHAARKIGQASTSPAFQLSAMHARHRPFGLQSIAGYVSTHGGAVTHDESRNHDEIEPSHLSSRVGVSGPASTPQNKDSKVEGTLPTLK
jgi:phosphoenolpyruvate mutase